jgi:hypothetical protein
MSSKASTDLFFAKLAADADLRKEMAERWRVFVAGVVSLAESQGFAVDAAEVSSRILGSSGSKELSEAELDGAAGGVLGSSAPFIGVFALPNTIQGFGGGASLGVCPPLMGGDGTTGSDSPCASG